MRSALLLVVMAGAAFGANDSVTAAKYKATADRLIDAALASKEGMDRFEYLCYGIGSRLSGSESLNTAIDWSEVEMKKAGLEKVRRIAVKVPHWVRGGESAELIEPVRKPLFMLGLGGSVATPPDGITAGIVPVSSFDEMDRLGREGVAGKIVVYDVPYEDYGKTVQYRAAGASRAARLGAVAVLVRSITPRSLRDPHTGSLNYTGADPKIPAAAISVEDAIYLHRLVQMGQRVRVRLSMEAHTEPEADSADVMGEITGSAKPNEVVVIGGHIDSWDVGQGAHDDGGGVMAALEAVSLMKKLGLRPRRTLRVVFWTNEENGGRGGAAYRDWAQQKGEKHIAAIEMDGGAESPIGFELSQGGTRTPRGAVRAVKPALAGPVFEQSVAIAQLLRRINATKILPGEGEADIAPLMRDGVPGFGLRTVMTHYFDYHHTNADTFDKIVPEEFKRCVAAFAVMSYALADWP